MLLGGRADGSNTCVVGHDNDLDSMMATDQLTARTGGDTVGGNNRSTRGLALPPLCKENTSENEVGVAWRLGDLRFFRNGQSVH